MIRATFRKRTHPKGSAYQEEIDHIIDRLINGDKVKSIPDEMKLDVLTSLKSRRKDTLLHRGDSVANRIAEIIGELENGPDAIHNQIPHNSSLLKSQIMSRGLPSIDNEMLKNTAKSMILGKQVDAIDNSLRRSLTPYLTSKWEKEISRQHYDQGSIIEESIIECKKYKVDSYRIGPRLLMSQNYDKRLMEARKKYDEQRMLAKEQLNQFEELRRAAEVEFENKLKEELLELGSHVPQSLPLEFSKFSNKVLDAKERERYSALSMRYEDAEALRKEVHQMEKKEIVSLNDKFVKSYKLNRQHILKVQEQKREAFRDIWDRKKNRLINQTQQTIRQAKLAVEKLERELDEARRLTQEEFQRVKNSERHANTATLGTR